MSDNAGVTKRRIAWIDVAKGIAMLLVFYGHLGGSGDNPWFPNLEGSIWVVYLFHMPLFFVLSGLTFNPHKDFRNFLYSRFKRLVIPYFFFSLYTVGKILLHVLAPAVFAGFHGNSMGAPLSELGNILLGNTQGLWFFLALFWGDLALFGLYQLTKNMNHPMSILGIVFILSGVAWFALNFLDWYKLMPFQLLRATEAVAFVGMGWMLSSWIKDISNHQAVWMLVGATGAFAVCALLAYKTDTHEYGWMILPSSIVYLLAALFGSFMIIALARLLPVWSWLTYIGRNTMVFYGLNGLSLAIARKLIFMVLPVAFVSSQLVLQVIVGLAVIAIACLVCACATPILARWFWWGIGLPKPVKKRIPMRHVAV